MLFAAPQVVMLGDQMNIDEVVQYLRGAGYGTRINDRMGWYNVRPDAVEIFPGPDSYFDQEEGVLKFAGGKVAKIISLRDNSERTQYLLEPQLITNLFDRNREKRRIVHFDEIPPRIVQAITSAEDKRFFQHSGFDPLRIIKAAYVDLRKGYSAEGASTLSMQVARGFWLTPEKTFKRKLAETIITLHLEQTLSKQQIFEYYANHVDLGRRGSFAIRGVGEAAQAYFNKDLRDLSIAESATIAGLIQRPSYTNPVRWPDRARSRRNIVLQLMRDNGDISAEEYQLAVNEPLVISKTGSESTDAPYFVDLVNEWLQDQFADHDFQTNSYRVYTTLDMNLQHDAVMAVRDGMVEVDKYFAKRRAKDPKLPPVQAALVAIDTQTGEIKALIGGRDYGQSQLNRALAKRQPGSAFKPFVYAAALNSGIGGGSPVLTPATTIVDEPTVFMFDGKEYQPSNFHDEWHGTVTMRQALMKSMNVPTVKLAEMIGFRNVVDLARHAGLNMDIRPTPAVALGAYEVTPIEVAGVVHHVRQQGHSREAVLGQDDPGVERIVDFRCRPGAQTGARPARQLPNGEHDGGRDPRRHGRGRALARLCAACRRKDRNLARRVVRRLHLQAHLRRMGRLRRQPRTRPRRREIGAAHLDRVHETGAPTPRVPECRQFRCARRRGQRRHRPGIRPACYGFLSHRAGRGVHLGHAAERILPPPRRWNHSRRRMGNNAGKTVRRPDTNRSRNPGARRPSEASPLLRHGGDAPAAARRAAARDSDPRKGKGEEEGFLRAPQRYLQMRLLATLPIGDGTRTNPKPGSRSRGTQADAGAFCARADESGHVGAFSRGPRRASCPGARRTPGRRHFSAPVLVWRRGSLRQAAARQHAIGTRAPRLFLAQQGAVVHARRLESVPSRGSRS